jgi:hypothetical protein
MTHTVQHFDFTKDEIQRYPYINPSVLDKLVIQYETNIEFNTTPLFCYTEKDAQSHCQKILCWLLSELSEEQFDSLIHKKIIDINELLYIFILIISSNEYECFDNNNEETYIWSVIKRIILRMSSNQFIQRFKLSGYSKQEKRWIIEEFNVLTYLITVAFYFAQYFKIDVLAIGFIEVLQDLFTKNEYLLSNELKSKLNVFAKKYTIKLSHIYLA